MPTVLIVEDDNDLLFLYHTALSQKGYNVIEARTSAQTMDLLQTPDFLPELIFMDIGMPDAPGTRAIEYMRGESRFDATKLVIVTANEMYRDRLVDKRISRFLIKPITISQLVAIAEELTV